MVSRKSKKTSLIPKRRIFVTGASGFLGQHFLDQTKDKPWLLYCLSRTPPLNQLPHVHWVRGDIRNPRSWSRSLKSCDTILHLATLSLTETEKDPFLASQVILNGIKNLTLHAEKNGIRRFISASTAEVYGSPQKLPISERCPLKPLSLYGFLKACADLYLIKTSKPKNLHTLILRFFNLYGPTVDGEVPPIVIKSFARQLLSGQTVTLHGSPTNSRDFLHVHDAVRALILGIENLDCGGVYNIGSGKEILLTKLASKIAKILHKKLSLEIRPSEGRKRRMAASIQKSRKKLGFKPKVSLDQGLSKMLKAILKK